MKRRGLEIPVRYRQLFYCISVVLFLTGAVWAWLHRLDQHGEASDTIRAAKVRLIQIHGFAALGFVLIFGTLIPVHIRHSWHAKKNLANGVFFLTAVSLLVLSGYYLYYLSAENVRSGTSLFHLWLGLAFPVLLITHILLGRRATR